MVTCPEIGHIANGTYNSTRRIYDSVINITCDFGFYIPPKHIKDYTESTELNLLEHRQILLQCTEKGIWGMNAFVDVLYEDFTGMCHSMFIKHNHSLTGY